MSTPIGPFPIALPRLRDRPRAPSRRPSASSRRSGLLTRVDVQEDRRRMKTPYLQLDLGDPPQSFGGQLRGASAMSAQDEAGATGPLCCGGWSWQPSIARCRAGQFQWPLFLIDRRCPSFLRRQSKSCYELSQLFCLRLASSAWREDGISGWPELPSCLRSAG